jgi:hypothetical protein
LEHYFECLLQSFFCTLTHQCKIQHNEMQQTMRPAAPPTHNAPNVHDKPLAFVTNNAVRTSEPFVTPDRMDKVNKEQTKALPQASKNAKKRYAAVAANPVDNGVSAFSTEMQHERATTTQNQEEPAVNITPKATLRNETTQTGGAICVAHLCHVDLVRLNWGERLRQI